ncbi:MAG: class I SAM-dependent methyltransferase [Geodermatophilaceae bacterium]|nr:class I SAM-dependent methyltransferase [Geodermatophilaceae bacterium]
MTRTDATASRWSASDVEQVDCCICAVPGAPLYAGPRLDPFAVVRCPRCALVFVSPRLRPAALQQVYDDTGYFDDGVYGAEDSMAMRLQRTWTAGRLGMLGAELGRGPGGAAVLEVGCGYGLFLAAARDAGYTTTGVELSAPAAAHARDRLGLTMHEGQLEDAPLPAGGYDAVLAWDTIEHVPDPVAFLRTVRGLLAPDGVLLFSTPYFSSWPARLLRTRWWTLKPAEHIWHFTPRTHEIALARAGMRLVRTVRSPLARGNLARLDSLVGVARPGPG